MGLDDRRQATGRDSGECPKTVTDIYISTINANTSTNSLQNLKFTELRRNQYPPPHVPRVITPPIPSNATKIGNPTSQCALLGLKLVQLSTLAGRIFFFVTAGKFQTEYARS